MLLIWGEGKVRYFCRRGWTGQIRLNLFYKLAFAVRGAKTSMGATVGNIRVTVTLHSPGHVFLFVLSQPLVKVKVITKQLTRHDPLAVEVWIVV